MNPPSIGPADVTCTGGLYGTIPKLRLARIDLIGNSPQARAKLYDWRIVKDGAAPRFVEFDVLANATITENANTGKYTITGTSQLAVDTGQGQFSEADCVATWEITVTGRCSDCG